MRGAWFFDIWKTSLCGLWEEISRSLQTLRQHFFIAKFCNISHGFAGLHFSTLHFTKKWSRELTSHGTSAESCRISQLMLIQHNLVISAKQCHCCQFVLLFTVCCLLFTLWLDCWVSWQWRVKLPQEITSKKFYNPLFLITFFLPNLWSVGSKGGRSI